MPLHLTTPLNIKTGFMVDLTKTGSTLELLSLTFRLNEGNVLVEYRIPSDDGERDHRNAVALPLEALGKYDLSGLLTAVYAALGGQNPELVGTVDVSTDAVIVKQVEAAKEIR